MLVGVLVLMGLMQIVIRNFSGNSVNAGPERGDIRLTEDVLPTVIDGWKLSEFQEPTGKGGVAGIIGWTHSWNAQRDGMGGIVCFDQVGFMGWHELTMCYEATGWTASNRTLKTSNSPQTGEWHSVCVELAKPQNEKALLIYSIFDGMGSPKKPPELTGYVPGSGLSSEAKRCLQCQVMLPYQGKLSGELLDIAHQLHVATRELFREEWLKQRSVK